MNRHVIKKKIEYFVCKEVLGLPMRNILFCLVAFLIISRCGYGQSHGLEFYSHEAVPEKRTSLHLTPVNKICLAGHIDISFDLSLKPGMETYFGYITRFITDQRQNIDLVYNQRLQRFNCIIGETISGYTDIDTMQFYGVWNRFSIRFDAPKQEVSFFLNDKQICKGRVALPDKTCSQAFFGANSYEGFQTTDIPPMRIKDIRITQDGKLKYDIPLSESTGLQAKDRAGNLTGDIKNPAWIKPKHQNWAPVKTLSLGGTPSIAFDPKQEVLYIIAKDSLYQLSFRKNRFTGTALSKQREVLPAGNQSVYNGQLVNFYIDQQAVSIYDTASRSWNPGFVRGELTEYWHANKFYSPVDTSLYIMNGYGQLQYKNKVQRYHFPSHSWEILKPTGDTLMPRYMAALGVNAAGDTAYILGGYGSNTGDQSINPKYTYELSAYSVCDRRFKHIYNLKEPEEPFCVVNSLVLDTANRDYYTLSYPIDKFTSRLQLIRCSLDKPDYQLMGDTIPYPFHDINSFADLYYCPLNKKLVAVTMFHSPEDVSSIKVYTLDFPPNPVEVVQPERKRNLPFWLTISSGIAILLAAVAIRRFRKKKAAPAPVQALITEDEPQPEKSSIFLFGQFEVFDKEGNNITKQFTPLVRELFLLVLIYTYKDGKGISAEELYEILWTDKPAKDARNNFSVNIVKLKAILDKVGEYHIGKESGKWKFEILNNSVQADYQQYTEWLASRPALQKPSIHQLLQIVRRGQFLKGLHYEWLDDIKSNVSGHITDLLLQYITGAGLQQDPEFIIKTANTLLHFDNLNEEALNSKCRCLVTTGKHKMAKDAYAKFAKEYKESYGMEFGKSYADVVQEGA